MTWLAVALVLAAALQLWHVSRVADDVLPLAWPEEAPLQQREERARDQRLNQLVRMAAADDPARIHAELVGIVRLLGPERGGHPSVRSFLAAPPTDPDRYRRELTTLLTHLEDG